MIFHFFFRDFRGSTVRTLVFVPWPVCVNYISTKDSKQVWLILGHPESAWWHNVLSWWCLRGIQVLPVSYPPLCRVDVINYLGNQLQRSSLAWNPSQHLLKYKTFQKDPDLRFSRVIIKISARQSVKMWLNCFSWAMRSSWQKCKIITALKEERLERTRKPLLPRPLLVLTLYFWTIQCHHINWEKVPVSLTGSWSYHPPPQIPAALKWFSS